ncbi:MAG: tetratricopeptide repeat protein [Verrucomicrobiota bacterium]
MRTVFLALNLLLLLSFVHSESVPEKTSTDTIYEKKITEAISELGKQNFSKALSLAEEAEKLKPDNSSAANLKGRIYIEQKDFPKALEIFTKLATQSPDNIGAQYNLAEAIFAQGKLSEAREKFSKVLETVKALPKDQENKLPFGPITQDFLTYKIYLTYVFEENLVEAKKQLDKFDPYATSPLYYFGCAAMEFANKNNLKAMEWIGSASKIYDPSLLELFSNAFFDKGWIRRGSKPGEIATDLGPPVEKKP